MIDPVTPGPRAPRAPQAKSDAGDAGRTALAATKAAFDLAASEHAEAERERAILEELMLAQLKDEDEIVKKWIAMI
jgi:hypothetical protein